MVLFMWAVISCVFESWFWVFMKWLARFWVFIRFMGPVRGVICWVYSL